MARRFNTRKVRDIWFRANICFFPEQRHYCKKNNLFNLNKEIHTIVGECAKFLYKKK